MTIAGRMQIRSILGVFVRGSLACVVQGCKTMWSTIFYRFLRFRVKVSNFSDFGQFERFA